ncbi:Vacuolar transporter chaperone 1 [Elsinoe australis]|uniref:alpha-galactosidase n=1 Tax=Elsinoe australis TaxID=40998 RepID=A0A2P8A105_9PEZI|nr:Vacuolar transporter chaperone 1 [Elsinoe australis]
MHSSIVFALLAAGIVTAAPPKELWQPAAGTTWQIVLNQKCDAETAMSIDAQAYDLDLFETEVTAIQALHAAGKKVICYFSAGSYEPSRPDSSQFQSGDLGSVMDGWPDEKWLNTKTQNVRNIMSARIALAAQKGCDAIDPDNVDGYGNDNGVGLTQADAVDFVSWMADQAANAGVAIGLKNAGDIIPQVMSKVHFSVNEQCHAYGECATYQPFIENSKPVFNIEYPGSVTGNAKIAAGSSCNSASSNSHGFSTILKNMDLDTSVEVCPASAGYGNAPAPSYSTVPSSAPSSSAAPAPVSSTAPASSASGYGDEPVPSSTSAVSTSSVPAYGNAPTSSLPAYSNAPTPSLPGEGDAPTPSDYPSTTLRTTTRRSSSTAAPTGQAPYPTSKSKSKIRTSGYSIGTATFPKPTSHSAKHHHGKHYQHDDDNNDNYDNDKTNVSSNSSDHSSDDGDSSNGNNDENCDVKYVEVYD